MTNKFLVWLKKFWIFLLLQCIISPIFFCHTSYEIITPGEFTQVNEFISIDQGISNQFYTTSVYVLERPTAFQVMLASLSSENEISKLDYQVSYLSTKDYYYQGIISKLSSINDSIICSYEEAKKVKEDVSISYSFKGYSVYYLEKDCVDLQIGDLILGTKLNEEDEYDDSSQMFSEIHGNSFYAKVSRIKKNVTSDDFYSESSREILDIYVSRDTGKQGISIMRYEEIDYSTIFPVCKFYGTSTGGNSGGLLQTLSLYYQILGIQIPKSLHIAGTGTMSLAYHDSDYYLDSSVGAIGGMVQKIYTANHHDIDIFFCPMGESNSSSYENYEEAISTYQKLKQPHFTLVPVSNLEEAILYLEVNYAIS